MEKELTYMFHTTIVDLKRVVYLLVERYNEMCFAIEKQPSVLKKIAIIYVGKVDNFGEPCVDKEEETKFAAQIIDKCKEFAVEWMHFFRAVDIFVEEMMDFVDVGTLLRERHPSNKHLKKLCRYWCGDVDTAHTKVAGLKLLTANITTIMNSLSINSMDKFYETVIEKDLDPTMFISRILDPKDQ